MLMVMRSGKSLANTKTDSDDDDDGDDEADGNDVS